MDIVKSKYLDKLELLNEQLYRYDTLKIENKSSINILDWFIEILRKNYAIYLDKSCKPQQDQETYSRPKSNVFLISPRRIGGSESKEEYYAIVLYELDNTALIIPFVTKNNVPTQWITHAELIVDIGLVKGLPLKNEECLAYIGEIQLVSKKRLSRITDIKTGISKDISLSTIQLSMISQTIIRKLFTNIWDIIIVL